MQLGNKTAPKIPNVVAECGNPSSREARARIFQVQYETLSEKKKSKSIQNKQSQEDGFVAKVHSSGMMTWIQIQASL